MKNPNLDEIVKSLHEAGIPPYISEGQSRLFIEVLRLVGKGQPVSPEQVKEIIVTLKLSPDETDEAISLIKKVSETDNNNIVGLFGLSLPSLLKQTAKVESLCPVTKEKIQLRLSPEKVEQSEPKNAVLSIVVPKPTEDGSSYGSEIRMLFCQFVRFFSSRDVAIEWFKGKGYDPIVLPIEEGYQLGRMAFKEVLKYA
jgi:hypothetical protein